jgi:archaellum component FlaG (FlaF/FlaG flagellin family)
MMSLDSLKTWISPRKRWPRRITWLAAGLLVLAGAGEAAAATITVQSLKLTSARLAPGQVVKGIVRLNQRAPARGIRVRVRSLSSAVKTSTAIVVIAPGRISSSFVLRPGRVSRPTAARIEARLGKSRAVARITILPPPPPPVTVAVKSLTLSSARLAPGQTVKGIVGLNVKAPAGGIRVKLRSANPVARLNTAVVIIRAGQTAASFAITPGTVSQPTVVRVEAQLGNSRAAARITILPPPFVPITKTTSRIQFTGFRFVPITKTTQRIQFTGFRFVPITKTTQRIQFTGFRFVPITKTTQRIQFTGFRFVPITRTTQRIRFTGFRARATVRPRLGGNLPTTLKAPRAAKRPAPLPGR